MGPERRRPCPWGRRHPRRDPRRIDTIEHASLIDAEGIRLARERSTVLVPMDIYNTEYTQAQGAKNGILEDNLRKDREIAQLQRDNFRAAHGRCAHALRHRRRRDAARQVGKQFRVMVEYGMTPMEAIQAATRDAAQALVAKRTSARSPPAAMPISSRSTAIR